MRVLWQLRDAMKTVEASINRDETRTTKMIMCAVDDSD